MTAPTFTLSVLVIDDDGEGQRVAELFAKEGFTIEPAWDVPSALRSLRRQAADIVVANLDMAIGAGPSLVSRIRSVSSAPVIALSYRDNEADRVNAIRLGADDYLVRPFSHAELVARAWAILRRVGHDRPASAARYFDGLVIDLDARQVVVHERVVDVTNKEFELLAALASAPRRVFSRQQLLDRIWGDSPAWQNSATLTEHIHRLRKKIELNPNEPRWIRTVRGVGYRFET